MDQVHVIQVLVEGRSQRRVAREFGLSRVTVRKYVEGAEPVRREAGPRARPVWAKVGPRIEALLEESKRWTGGKQQLTATRLHELLIVEGHFWLRGIQESVMWSNMKFTNTSPGLCRRIGAGPFTKKQLLKRVELGVSQTDEAGRSRHKRWACCFAISSTPES